MKEPLDSILSGGGEAVSGQTAQTNDVNASSAGEGGSPRAEAGEHPDAYTADTDAADAYAGSTRMVPHQALHAERQKVRRYTEEVADFRKALAETNAAFERRIGQLVAAIAPQVTPPAPDFFDNPEAATRHSVVQTVSPEFERINQTLHAFARDQAIGRFDEAKVNDAEQAFLGAVRTGQLDPADYRRVVGSANRYAEAVRWHQRQSARAEIGDDPAAYKARVEAELREQILAELGGGGAGHRFAQLAPSNLAGARNVAGRAGPAWSGPASLNDIFDRSRK